MKGHAMHISQTAAAALLAACEAALLREDVADSELGDQLRAAIEQAKTNQ